MPTALLCVDIQSALTAEAPYRIDLVLRNVRALQDAFRAQSLPVLHVQHNDPPGGELDPATPGWAIDPRVAPLPGEHTFQKHHNSAFYQTGLLAHLQSLGTGHIILCGLQTEYRIDATCKAAFEHGLRITIPQDANTTYANEYLPADRLHAFYNQKIWPGRFATVCDTTDLL